MICPCIDLLAKYAHKAELFSWGWLVSEESQCQTLTDYTHVCRKCHGKSEPRAGLLGHTWPIGWPQETADIGTNHYSLSATAWRFQEDLGAINAPMSCKV